MDAEVVVLPYAFVRRTKVVQALRSRIEFLVNSGILGDGRSKICKLFYIFKSCVINCDKTDITGL